MTESAHEAHQAGGAPGRRSAERPARAPSARPRLPATALIVALAGAVLLLAAEISPLYHLHVAARHAAVGSSSTGAHDAYGLIPLAALAGAIALVAWRAGGRVAIAAIAVLGLAALGIALLGDLPAARAQGVLRLRGHLVLAHAAPASGFYLETLGAILVLLSGGWGLLLPASD